MLETEPELDQLVELREYNSKTDDALVYQTWLNGLYFGSEWFRMMNHMTYKKRYREILNLIIPRSTISCCVLKEDPDVILGYSVIQKDCLHWVFVKASWRRIGVATKLISPNIKTISHLTEFAKSLKPRDWEFNPFLQELK